MIKKDLETFMGSTKDVKKFLLRSLLLVPLAAVMLILPTIILWKAGEFERIDHIVDEQAKNGKIVLFEKAYNGKIGYYALRVIRKRKPQVIALGSSRVMPFRSKFFKPGVTFYNAGGGAAEIRHFRAFLARIPEEATPKMMIVGIDQGFFNPNRVLDLDSQNAEKLFADASLVGIWKSSFQKVLADYVQGKFRLKDVFIPRSSEVWKIGLAAIATDSGALNDGSHYYGGFIRNPQADTDWEFRVALSEIASGTGYFQYAQESSPAAFKELDVFLAECRRRNIHVVGFLPPFPHEVYQAMKGAGNRYAYLNHLSRDAELIFKNHGFSLFDFSDLAWVGAPDEETYDGHHGSEKAYLRLFMKMAQHDSVLAESVDENYLKMRLEKSDNPYVVFGIDEF